MSPALIMPAIPFSLKGHRRYRHTSRRRSSVTPSGTCLKCHWLFYGHNAYAILARELFVTTPAIRHRGHKNATGTNIIILLVYHAIPLPRLSRRQSTVIGCSSRQKQRGIYIYIVLVIILLVRQRRHQRCSLSYGLLTGRLGVVGHYEEQVSA